MEVPRYVQIAFVVVILLIVIMGSKNYVQKDGVEAVHTEDVTDEATGVHSITPESITSQREIQVTEEVRLPIADIVYTQQVTHSIPIEEIRQGCSRQDCIPSVDNPQFLSTEDAVGKIDPSQIGIALSYKDEDRFYPFSMLVTKEIVNDVVAGDALLITYCPLCGTGIVFDRTVDGVVYEFGVSGMLWQSNLLMYNRAEKIENRNLWSQVLGEAVVGERTGTKLEVVSSDIMQFKTWSDEHTDGLVLDTGSQRDPYAGEYFSVAQRFAPNYDLEASPLAPDTYVYGIEVGGVYKAYPRDVLTKGTFRDMINGEEITVSNSNEKVSFTSQEGEIIEDVEGFWFSWVAVHPQTLIWNK